MRLDNIERNYAVVAPLIPPSEVHWLIARVRKLETALIKTHNRLDSWELTVAVELACELREALKES